MAQLLKDEKIIEQWQSFLENNCKPDIETLATEYPKKRSVYINYEVLDKKNSDLAELLIDQPVKYIFNAEESFREINTAKGIIRPHVRFYNLPDACKKTIRELRSENIGKFVCIEGLVKKNTSVKADIKVAAFHCQKCGAILKIEQTEEILKEPIECYEDQGGCGRTSTFILMTSLSGFLDGQKIQLQENPEGLKGGQQPEKITIYLDDDLVGKIYPGDRIKINGIVQGIQRRKGNVKLISFDFVIVANNLENITSLYEDIIITDVDIKEIKKVASNPQIHEMLRDSLVPSIHGYKIEKEGAILQLFGGNSKELPDGTKIRGDIHSLFVGDPGIGKSQLLYGIYKLSPRGIFSTGTGASGVGLTAAAVKDDFGDGQWSLEAGALVLADGGIACIDEIDKMDETDRENLHPAMEQQEIPISKAGINATLKSRCAVMATANPKFGRFDEYMPLTKQIELSSVLLSRFDLIWTIQDKPKPDIDLKLAKYILNTRRNPKNKDNAPVFEPEFIRKYIAYAKQNCKPELTDEAQEKIQDFYVDMRKISNETIAITPRQLESIVRLSEASAKVRLSKEVLISDVDRAIRIINEYLKRVCTDWETGKIDVDTIFIGTTHTQQERMKIIRSIIENSPDGMANIDDIIQEAEIKGIESNKTKEALEQMKQDKYIFENGKGRFKIQC